MLTYKLFIRVRLGYIDVALYFQSAQVELGLVIIKYVPLVENAADGFTKVFNKAKFERF